ncbi:MAG: asparagine synthetase B, partial [Deltaproteobacteria bacterium]|nr:asparagine synthetase B [Deltaproteobacteria bacterium]
MCGITGSWGRPGTEEALSALVAAMARRIASRGPDDTGSFCEPDVGLAFGHRRLSILDLSPHGHQPMSSRDGRFVLCYNGEIYNFRELAGELADAGVALRGHSDTEVLVEAVALWGLEATLPRLIGIGVTRSGLVFGSDLAALRAHPDFDPQLNRDAVALLLRLQYVPCPYSIYLGIHKLAPGHRISLTGPDALTGSDAATPSAWWDPIDVAARASREPFGADGRELTDEVERVLGDAVEDRMVADVPLGAFLSGGIDSSTVVA